MLLDSAAAADLPPRPVRGIWQWDRQVEVQLPMLEKAEVRVLLAGRYALARGEVEASEIGVEVQAHAA